MDYKVTLIISGAKTREEAENAVDEMLDKYDFYGRAVEDGIEIYLPVAGEVEKAEAL